MENNPGTTIAIVIAYIITIILVGYIAHNKGRYWANWSFPAFFFPIIALVIILFTEKKLSSGIVYPTLNREQNSELLCEKAFIFFEEGKFEESLLYAEKAIQLDAANILARDIMKKSRLEISNTEKEVE